MRKALKELRERDRQALWPFQAYVSFRGTGGSRQPRDSVQLENVCLVQNGRKKNVASHIWLYGRDAARIHQEVGTRVSFMGKVKKYQRRDGSPDYKIKHITGVVTIEEVVW